MPSRGINTDEFKKLVVIETKLDAMLDEQQKTNTKLDKFDTLINENKQNIAVCRADTTNIQEDIEDLQSKTKVSNIVLSLFSGVALIIGAIFGNRNLP